MANIKSIVAAHLSQRQRNINKQTDRAEMLDQDRLLCKIIRVDGNINVPGKPGFVWCQEYSSADDTNPFHAFNNKVQAREGLDVWIGEGLAGRREVLDWNNSVVVNTVDYNAQKYLPIHHSDHEWPDFKPGPDVVNIYPRSLSMLRTYPGEAGALTVSASPLRYVKSNALTLFPGKNSLDISAAQPASGLARFVGVYLDPDDNMLKSVNGATTGDSPVITPDSPVFPESAILSANVRLNGDQTSISEVDIVDIRQILDASGAIDGTRISKLISPDGLTDPVLSADNNGDVTVAGTASSGRVAINTTVDSEVRLNIKDVMTTTGSRDMALHAEIDTINNTTAVYVSHAVRAINRHRGTQGSTSSTGPNAFTGSMFNYNTGTTSKISGFRLDQRNLGAGIVTAMSGILIDTMQNTGGGTVASTFGIRIEAQTVGGSNFGIYQIGIGSYNYFGGSLGIGVVVPDTKLHAHLASAGAVTALANTVITAENSTSTYISLLSPDSATRGVIFGSPTSNVRGGIFYVGSSDEMQFRLAGNSTKVRIASSGNVGLNGVATPSTALDIGAGAIEGEEMTTPAAGAANTYRLFARDDGGGHTELCVRFNTGLSQVIAPLEFGEISVIENGTPTALTVVTEAQFLFFDTDGPANGATPDHTSDHITIGKTGTYLITSSLSVESASGTGYEVEFTVQKNNGTTQVGALHAHRAFAGGGGDFGSVSLSGLAVLTAGDTIELWIENLTSSQDVTIEDATLLVTMVGVNA